MVGPQKGFETVVQLPAGRRGMVGGRVRGRGRVRTEMKVDPVKYTHLVEGRRKAVQAGRGGLLRIVGVKGKKVSIGFAPAAAAVAGTPFVRPAEEALARAAKAELSARLLAEIDKIARQYARRGKSVYRG